MSTTTQRQPDAVLPLWPEGVPDKQGDTREDNPWLELYRPKNPTGAAVLVCPGGGYQTRAPHEAEPIAWWLNAFGITGIVVHYRVKPYKHPQPLNDVSRAMRIAKENAKSWNINPEQIGVLGFSAGGHLASTLSVHYDADTRPAFSILVYPVITLGNPSVHTGSRANLLPEVTQEWIDLLSNERHVNEKTPPTFIFHTVDDPVVNVENVFLYGAALNRHKVPFEMHCYETGRHGVGLAQDNPALKTWPTLCENWLRARGYAR